MTTPYAKDESSDLVSIRYTDASPKVYVHSGVSATISSSFAVANWTNGAAMDSEGGC